MTARRTYRVTVEAGVRSAWLWGDHAAIKRAIDRVGCKSMWDRNVSATTIPIQSFNDVLAAMEVRNVTVTEQVYLPRRDRITRSTRGSAA